MIQDGITKYIKRKYNDGLIYNIIGVIDIDKLILRKRVNLIKINRFNF